MHPPRHDLSIGRRLAVLAFIAVACNRAEVAAPDTQTQSQTEIKTPPGDSPGDSPPAPTQLRDEERTASGATELESALSRTDGPGATLRSPRAVSRFYANRGFRPAWTQRGRATPQAREIQEALEQLSSHGLDPTHYGVSPSADAAPASDDPTNATSFELRLTDAWLTAGAHLLRGRIDPVTVHPEWSATSRTADLVDALETGLSHGAPADALWSLAPSSPEYATLRAALTELREQQRAGQWPTISGTQALAQGSTGPSVAALRERLARTDGLADGTGDTFDAELAAAVRRFQARHGIETSGRVEARTRRALGVSIEQRIDQLVANLERWRWLPEDLGDRHIRVNIAAFDVVLFDGATRSLAMRAVVGKRYRKTPVFSSEITQITINPRWTAPPKIAVRDLLPAIQRDRSVLTRKRLRVFDARTSAEVDASTVPWSSLSARRFPYILKQDPGPDNALGRFRFGMPNDYDIYLHDTPQRHLFAEDQRTYSSGCVRLHEPRDLAVALLADHPKWNAERKLDAAVSAGRELTIRLSTPVPVHILYWTAFVDDEGRLQLRNDVYDRDTALIHALSQGPRDER